MDTSETQQPSDDVTVMPQEFGKLISIDDTDSKLIVSEAGPQCLLVLIHHQLAWIPCPDMRMAKVLTEQGKSVVFSRFVDVHPDVIVEHRLLGRPILLLKV